MRFLTTKILNPSIYRTEKDGDWYSSKNFKPSKHNAACTETGFTKKHDLAVLSSRFARYCGKMYSGHVFPYGGLDRGSSRLR